eukprot:g1694.t1
MLSVVIGVADAALIVVLVFLWLKGAATCINRCFGTLAELSVSRRVTRQWDMWQGGEAAVQARTRRKTVDAADTTTNTFVNPIERGAAVEMVKVDPWSRHPQFKATHSNDVSEGAPQSGVVTCDSEATERDEIGLREGDLVERLVDLGGVKTAVDNPKTRRFSRYKTKDGRVYFVNVDTKESVWDLPSDGEEVDAPF